MNKLVSLVLRQISLVGMSTANSISRACIYEPEEDIALSEMMSSRQNAEETK
ncbi:MAG: hypothetical protein HFI48_04090 [Lachnospiraceae bacterium]|nr:hypothetical protein [Lachnospiraceae bacterium]